MVSVERRQRILDILQERSSVSVTHLAGVLGVSEVTVRKMLTSLARQGLLRRTHGGAVSVSVPVREDDLAHKEKTRIREKKMIARHAYSLIEDCDSVFLDAGSTTLELARRIRAGRKRHITVVTNALNIAAELLDAYDLEVLLIGGLLRHDVVSCVGPLAENSLTRLHFDKAFLAANAFSLSHGASTPKLVEAQIKRQAAESASQAYLLCDSSKYGHNAMARFRKLEDFTAVICDAGLDPATAKSLSAAGVRLIMADTQRK